ncbi:MAG: hypothetical protein LBT13_03090 [Treponema sp.]|jgi:threonyl-tRNA synthetase|nr:hypothetical protein [Treponema sp.]
MMVDAEIAIYEHRIPRARPADLCRGPHLANTREINSAAFKLMNIAGAY